MIEVKHLTKRYGSHLAISDLNFTIEAGSVYGFLGPNGAGKSTTMNIITGCLGTTEGEVTIGGYSVFEEPVKAKALIGYLPEQPPLYLDMTCEEYLYFVMGAKRVPRDQWREQLEYAMGRTGIGDVRHRLLRNLSKGYRQRVGLAQALIGHPQVVILDEPTVGLDPAQIIEIRQLVRELGREHTVLFSSHILSEVNAVCDSILILSRGKLVASDTPENLEKLLGGAATIELVARAPRRAIEALLRQHPEWGAPTFSEHAGEEGVRVTLSGEGDPREALFYAFAQADMPIVEMRRVRASLEDVFLELTAQEETGTLADGKEAQVG